MNTGSISIFLGLNFFQQCFVIEDGCRNEHTVTDNGLCGAIREPYFRILYDGGTGFSSIDKPLFYPTMAHTAGIGAGPDITDRPQLGSRIFGRTVTGEHVAVFLPGEVCQLIKANEVIPFALVIGLVLAVLHGTEEDLCTGWKDPDMLGIVIPCLWKGQRIQGMTPVNQF